MTNTATTPEPHNEAAELAILGSLLIDPEAADGIFPELESSDFYYSKHAMIFSAMRELWRGGKPIDYVMLVDALGKNGQLEYLGGAQFLLSLISATPSAINAKHYAEIISKAAKKRKALKIASQIAAISFGENNGSDNFDQHLQALMTELAALIPAQEPEKHQADEIPALPFTLLQSSSVSGWINDYMIYANKISPMTPLRFHLSSALWLISSIVARRLYVPMDFARIYPNIWVLWVARSTIFGKSTSMDLTRRIARRTVPHILAAEDMTPEGLLLDMSGAEPANLIQMRMDDQQAWTERRNFSGQRAWTIDEFSGLLAASSKDYNSGMLEILLKFYECADQYDRLTAGRGLQTIHNAYLSLLSASTPTAMASFLGTERLWGMGWWPRFAILVPDQERPDWILPAPPTETEADALSEKLRELYQRLPQPRWPEPPQSLPTLISKDAFDLWGAYNKALRYDLLTTALEDKLWAAYGRLPIQALKIATLLAAMEWGDTPSPQIELSHIYQALAITEDWRYCLHKAIALIEIESQDKLKQAVIQQVSKNDPVGVTERDICKALKHKKPAEIERALDELLHAGEITSVEQQNSRGGPRTTRFVLSRD